MAQPSQPIDSKQTIASAAGVAPAPVAGTAQEIERVSFIAFRIFAALTVVASIICIPVAILAIHNPPLFLAACIVGIIAICALASTRQHAPFPAFNFFTPSFAKV